MPDSIVRTQQRFFTSDTESILWHDCRIHGLAFDAANWLLGFDFDLIVEWIDVPGPTPHYDFLVAPANLVFRNVHGMTIDVSADGGLQIETLTREAARRPKNIEWVSKETEWHWRIVCQEGELSFWSVGFDLLLREQPKRSPTQSLSLDARGGIVLTLGSQGQ